MVLDTRDGDATTMMQVPGLSSAPAQTVPVVPCGSRCLCGSSPMAASLVSRGGLLLLLLAALAAGEPRVELAASAPQVAVGENVTLTITYRWPRGWTVSPEPDPGPELGGLFVTAAPPPERSRTGEEERRTFRYTVAAARSGAWLLPRPAFTATGPGGAVEARAPEVVVQVGTEAAPPQLPAARPALIRPPPSLAPARRWPWYAGGTLLAAALAGLWWWRRQRRREAAALSAWQVLVQDLAAVRGAADGKELGAGLSLALRRYAGALWDFDGPGQTTREVGASLRRLGPGRIAEAEAADLLRLLGRLDDLRWSAGDLPAAAVADSATLAEAWAGAVQRRLDAEAEARRQAGRR